jgi:GTPase SAR1 family protein
MPSKESPLELSPEEMHNILKTRFEELVPKTLEYLEKEASDAPLYSIINTLVYILDQYLIPQMKEQVKDHAMERYIIDICNTLLDSAGARFRVPEIEVIDDLAEQSEEAKKEFLREIPPAGHS